MAFTAEQQVQLGTLNFTPEQLTGLQNIGMTFPTTGAATPGAAGIAGIGVGGNMGIGATGAGAGTGLGMNVGTGQLAIGGLSALGNLWTAYNSVNLARQSFDFNSNLARTNLANQAETYNTALGDRSNTRAVMEGRTQASADEYTNSHRLRGTL